MVTVSEITGNIPPVAAIFDSPCPDCGAENGQSCGERGCPRLAEMPGSSDEE